MRYKQRVYWLTLVFTVTAAGFASFQTGDGEAADALVIDPGHFQRMTVSSFGATARSLGQVGPEIDMRQPGEKKVFGPDEPVAVDIVFLPATDGSLPDMDTLEVLVRKGWFGKDITDTVKPYVRGNAIRVPQVDFSGYSGDFQFSISIKDRRKRGSQLWFSVTIQF